MRIIRNTLRKWMDAVGEMFLKPPTVNFLHQPDGWVTIQITVDGVVWHNRTYRATKAGKIPLEVHFWIQDRCWELSARNICSSEPARIVNYYTSYPITTS